MHPKRKQRLTLVAFLFAGVALAVGLALFALNENINLFYPPDQIARGEAPVDQRIRAGGMVLEGSVQRDPGSLAVRFTLSDMAGHNVPVVYEGITPGSLRGRAGHRGHGAAPRQWHFLRPAKCWPSTTKITCLRSSRNSLGARRRRASGRVWSPSTPGARPKSLLGEA